jgi:hypothetical protein
MSAMVRTAMFVLVVLAARGVLAQTPPPGNSYDARKHPNPIVTFVENASFKPADTAQAQKQAGMELLGLSAAEGQRESIEIADGRFVRNMSILGVRTDVTFYPVVRQKFRLARGASLHIHSFKFPRVSLPPDFTRIVLNEAAVEKKKKPSEMRFGGSAPERLDIRGTPGLLFEKDGEITVYWQEGGIGHTATASVSRKELFRLIDDLL